MSETQQADPSLSQHSPHSPEVVARINQGMGRLAELAAFGQTPEGTIFAGLSEELESFAADPEKTEALQGALLVWAQTPYVDGSRGPDGTGTNGGVEHFFAYRGDELKGVRWKTPGLAEYPATLEGFITLSAQLYEAVNHPETSDKTKMAYDASDEAGNVRRMGNFAGHHQYVSFRRAGEGTPFLVSSLYPVRDMSQIGTSVKKDAEKWTPQKEENYINKLVSRPTIERV